MVRDAMAEKGLPAFENNDFSKLYARLAAREQDIDKLRFLFFFQTTKSTQTMSSYAARLDIALADMIDRPTKGLDELLEEISAARTEESRVGKECVRTCRSRGWPYNKKQ